jgi:hypothetical protein
MAKKSFRPVNEARPSYPRPVELKGKSLCDLGLVAVGSLLLGNATCAPRSELRKDEGKPTAVDKDGKPGAGEAGDKNSGGNAPEYLPLPGVPPLPHEDEPTKK